MQESGGRPFAPGRILLLTDAGPQDRFAPMKPMIAAVLIALAGPPPVMAQIQLPGAFSPAPAGTVQAPARAHRAGARGPAAPAAAAVRVPGEETVAGRPLRLNGSAGTIEFESRDKTLNITKLLLPGEQISKPGEACEVNVVPGAPLAARPIGKPEGLLRYEVGLEICPMSFDILDGAILVGNLLNGGSPQLCEFKAADCRVSPAGLWGPHAGNLVGDRLKAIERSRAQADNSVRANFRVLLARARDKAEVKLIAREQAGFSSQREQLCRDYAREASHGFCATRISEAHAAALYAKIEAGNAVKVEKKRP